MWVEPTSQTTTAGQGVTDVLRKQIKTLIDILPACELHSARVFLEYLRDRGTAELTAEQKPLTPVSMDVDDDDPPHNSNLAEIGTRR